MATPFVRMSRTVALAALVAAGLSACTNSQEASDQKGTPPPVFTSAPAPGGAGSDTLSGVLKDPSGKAVGKATFTAKGGYLEISVTAEGLKPGFHGLHVHQNGVCTGDFTSAGGHFQAEGAVTHPHTGDLTSLQVRKDGSAELTTTTDAFTLGDLRNDGKGRALIIHAGPDNFGNIPDRYTKADGSEVPDETSMATGDAGPRAACAVLK